MKSGITLCSQMLSIVIENKILPCTHRKNANYLFKKKGIKPWTTGMQGKQPATKMQLV